VIIRNISIHFGNALVETTPFTGDANVGGEEANICGLRMKNLTDADCVGAIDLVFLNRQGLEFFKRKLSEMEDKWECELNKLNQPSEGEK
jgi:hypothetical protein